MKYIVYLTVNTKSKINGHNRIYIGVHKTEVPDIFDGYIGCGVIIHQPSTYKYPKTAFQYAVKQYGIAAFKRYTLFVFDNPEDAYNKEKQLVTKEFIALSYTYNMIEGGLSSNCYRPLYQFDLNGKLVKEWKQSIDAYMFYGYPPEKWENAKRNRCVFLDSFWSTSKEINILDFTLRQITKQTYLYNSDGKLLNVFNSQAECARYISYDSAEISRAVRNQTLIKNQFYVSDSLVDEFKPKARKQYINKTFYVYQNGQLISKCVGKELMSVIKLNSWDRVSHIFTKYNNWYKDYYISLVEIDIVPAKSTRKISVDIYTKFGEYLETLNSCKEVREKYKVPSYVLKNIKLGDKYYKDYIFKYNSK